MASPTGSKTPRQPQPQNAPGVRDQLDALVLHTQGRIAALVRTWEGLGQAPELMQGRWREQVTDDRRVQSLTFVLIFLFLGAGLEWLFRQYSNPMRRRLEITQFKTPATRITAAVTRAGLALTGLCWLSLLAASARSLHLTGRLSCLR